MATMVGTMREQLLAARQQTASFEGIVADYMNLMHRIRELEVRNAQLDREAGELRLENDTLLSTLDDARRGTVSSAEVSYSRSLDAD